jgi:hypothetical protein
MLDFDILESFNAIRRCHLRADAAGTTGSRASFRLQRGERTARLLPPRWKTSLPQEHGFERNINAVGFAD